MENYLSIEERVNEQACRRSAMIVALLAVAIVCVVLAGVWGLMTTGNGLPLYASIAVGAVLTDPLRKHLHQL